MAYAPKLGGSQSHSFPLQFSASRLNIASFACTLIKQLSNDGENSVISHGSGCFWRHQEAVFLITARHVLTGRSPFDDTLLSKKGYIPRTIEVYPTLKSPTEWARTSVKLEINHDPQNWLQDPEFESLRTDIAAVLLCNDASNKICCINDDDDVFEELFSMVGMACSVVGYPTTEFSGLMTPIWRSGTIASEPRLPLDDKPMFLLDAATSPGFSGAPVFRQHFGPLPTYNENGEISVKIDNVRVLSLVGIYAGRLEHSHFGGEVPFVFYANRIGKIFEIVNVRP